MSLDFRLRALAGPGLGSTGDFKLVRGERTIDVALGRGRHDTLTSLTLGAPYDGQVSPSTRTSGTAPVFAIRPLDIELRREAPGDTHQKDIGHVVEWRSGDREFDELVFVDTPTMDLVLAKVLGPEVRQGAIELMRVGFEEIRIDVKGRVEAKIPAPQFASIDESGAVKVLAAFELMLQSLPPLQHTNESRPKKPLAGITKLLGVVGVVGWVGHLVVIALLQKALDALHPGVPEFPIGPFLVSLALAIGGGIVGARFYSRALARRVRGTSSAHADVNRALINAFGGFSVLTFALFFVSLTLLWRGGR